jgi:DNA (cytosine-5)-methyltransferase 1
MKRLDAESETLIPVCGGGFDEVLSVNDVAHTLLAKANDSHAADLDNYIVFQSKASASQSMNPGDVAPTLDVSKSGGMAVAFAIQERAVSENVDAGPQGLGIQEGVAYALEARHHAQAVAFDLRGREGGSQFEGPHDTANIRAASGGSSRSYVAHRWAVRRLTPRECERLQGFPDGYTLVPDARGKLAADGPRYKQIGNSMAVNVMAWIGDRLGDAIDVKDGAAFMECSP